MRHASGTANETMRINYAGPDGVGVVCVTVATVRDGRISTQTAVQVWDS